MDFARKNPVGCIEEGANEVAVSPGDCQRRRACFAGGRTTDIGPFGDPAGPGDGDVYKRQSIRLVICQQLS